MEVATATGLGVLVTAPLTSAGVATEDADATGLGVTVCGPVPEVNVATRDGLGTLCQRNGGRKIDTALPHFAECYRARKCSCICWSRC